MNAKMAKQLRKIIKEQCEKEGLPMLRYRPNKDPKQPRLLDVNCQRGMYQRLKRMKRKFK